MSVEIRIFVVVPSKADIIATTDSTNGLGLISTVLAVFVVRGWPPIVIAHEVGKKGLALWIGI